MNRCPLVLVEWLDSRQPPAGWHRLSSYEPAGVCVCVSVGWLIHDGDVKALAPNMADIGDDEEDMQALGIIHIPAPAVKRIVALTEATSSPCGARHLSAKQGTGAAGFEPARESPTGIQVSTVYQFRHAPTGEWALPTDRGEDASSSSIGGAIKEEIQLISKGSDKPTKKTPTKKSRRRQAFHLETQELVAAPESQSERLDPPAVMVGKRRLDEPKKRY